MISGPATDNQVGRQFIERELGVPGLNSRTDGDALAARVIAVAGVQAPRAGGGEDLDVSEAGP